MATVIMLSDDALRAERARLVESTGLSEADLRERAGRYEITPDQADALSLIDEVSFLLDGR